MSKAAKHRVAYHLHSLKKHFSGRFRKHKQLILSEGLTKLSNAKRLVFILSADCLVDARQNLAAPRLVGKQDGNCQSNLSDLLQTLHSSQVEEIKSALNSLQVPIHLVIAIEY